ncbi:hypothetical protein R4464_04565 [Acinetobacter baumannii]|nr:hypothetical protein [Acinetobacter baumannii]
MSNKVTTPYPLFSDIDGSPLNAGFLFLGESGKDPELFPIQVYWDKEKTDPAEQPIRTKNGYPSKNGIPSNFYVEDSSFSVTLKNRNQYLIASNRNFEQFANNSFVITQVEAEKQRALLAESALQTNINTENTRATGAESTLNTKIDNETSRALGVEQSLQLQISTSNAGIKYFSTEAEVLAFTPSAQDPKQAYAFDTKKNYLWNGTAWIDEGVSQLDQANNYTKTALTKSLSGKIEVAESSVIYTVDGVSLFGVYQGDFFVADLNVSEGETFLITSTGQGSVRSFYTASSDNVIKSYGEVSTQSQFVTIPANATRLVVNCLKSARNTFSVKLLSNDEATILQKAKDIPDASTLIKRSLSGNIDTVLNKVIYAPDGQTLTPVAHSDFLVADVSVEAGQWYLITSDASGSVRAYYTANGNTVKSYGEVTESLKFVQIPVGANRLIVNSLISTKDKFSVKLLSKDEVTLFKSSQVVTTVRDAFPSRPSYPNLLKEKCPKFYEKLKGKTGDLTVCLTGTSLTQGNLYATDRSDATTRPPQLHTNDLASAIFDSLICYWDGQQYRRYDHSDLTYSSSAWAVTNDVKDGENSVWDDRAEYRNGLTKTTTSANASVAMTIPSDAWQFNFIYRSDSQGGNCTVAISEGNSKVEVFNGTVWVEANGFTFSMLESAATATKGNTIFQKRLKMRCKNKAGGINSIGSTKRITITKANDNSRFNVIGFEWSPREYMLTFINAARGSHNWGLANGYNLENYQDGDIWNFNPDLILCEATIINWGGSWGYDVDPLYYSNIAKRTYFNEFNDNPNSLYVKSNSYQNCEIIFYGDTVSAHDSQAASWNGKQPKFATVTTAANNGNGSTENVGRVKNIFENYAEVERYMSSKEHVFIPVSIVFKNVADKYFGNYWDAFRGTDKAGATLSFDAIHLNDNGAALWSSLICPLFDNL